MTSNTFLIIMYTINTYKPSTSIKNNLIKKLINKKICLAFLKLESVTFESYKPFYYTTLFSKVRKINCALQKVITADRASFKSWAAINFINQKDLQVTKTIDDFSLFQDLTLSELRVDENVVKMQRKYNFE